MTNTPARQHTGLIHLLESKGRYGDNMLVHVNPAEALMLKMLGGSGTRNPRTGLLEFFAGGPGGVGRTGGGSVAGGASGIGGRGIGGGGSGAGGGGNSSGTGKDDGSGGTYKGASDGTTSTGPGGGLNEHGFRSTGAGPGASNNTVTSTGGGTLGGGTGSGSLAGDDGADPTTERTTLQRIGDFFRDVFSGASLGGAIGSWGGPVTGVIGAGGGAILGAADNLGVFDKDKTINEHGFRTTGAGPGASNNTVTHTHGGLGQGNSRGDSGNLGGLGQNAQQNNAGGGLVATPTTPPAAPPTIGPAPTTPDQLTQGLLAYLAQNPGMLQGYTGSSRFGTGTVSPFSYYRPIA